MRPHEIENWALDIIDRVVKGQPVEDTRVELKTEWPADHAKAARRIAGHANASRGEPILWLIGVDEAGRTIPGVDFSDLASWYNQVRSNFDELAPEPVSINVPVNGVTVAALFYETDRAPYVVKNPSGGAIQREVPWREATSLKSATRSQLLRLLSPLQKIPSVEVLGSLLVAEDGPSVDGKKHTNWEGLIALLLTQPLDQQTVFLNQQCSMSLEINDRLRSGPFFILEFRGAGKRRQSDAAFTITGCDVFEVRSRITLPKEQAEIDFNRPARINLMLQPVGHDSPIRTSVELTPSREKRPKGPAWSVGRHIFSA